MRIAIYGRKFSENSVEYIQELFDVLHQHATTPVIYEPFFHFIENRINFHSIPELFDSNVNLQDAADVLFSLGGDGTLLDTVCLVKDSNIPVLGLNMGRLGFLTGVSKFQISEAINNLLKGHFTTEKRILLKVTSDSDLFEGINYGLNEMVIHKKDSSSMITIHAYLNGEFLNSYWADGLIVSTPTGSTAYNLSCGGPIVSPNAQNLIVTPISPHNLNVRPLIIDDNSILTFEVEGRTNFFNISLDSRTESLSTETQFAVSKQKFCFNLLRLNNENYLSTLRSKLMWGIDSRN
jgi:NAD+ kinase